jgi:hypothetical protein
MDKPVPCQSWRSVGGVLLSVCGRPAYVRVRVICPCGSDESVFLCELCYLKLLAGAAQCGVCKQQEFAWRVT